MFVGNLQSSVINRLKIHELGMFASFTRKMHNSQKGTAAQNT